MSTYLIRTSAQQHVNDLITEAEGARVRRDLRRARRKFRKARRQALLGVPFQPRPVADAQFTGVRWGHRVGPVPAR